MILRNFFRSVIALSRDELAKCIYLCTNQLGPSYEGIELGIGDNIIMKAVSASTGRSMDQLKKSVEKIGDIGDVALMSKGKQTTLSFGLKPKPLMVKEVFKHLKEIALIKGEPLLSAVSSSLHACQSFLGCSILQGAALASSDKFVPTRWPHVANIANFISSNIISNILRCLYEKPSHNNRKCGCDVPVPTRWPH